MNRLLSNLFTLVLLIFSVYSFSNADLDFSLDYSVYMFYGKNINTLDFRYINSSFLNNLPLPYVFVPPAGYFEYGFVAVALILGQAGFTPTAAYSVIALSSLAIRSFIMTKAQVNLLPNILISLSFITLLEANALRLAVSSSLILVMIFHIVRRNNFFAAASLIVAISFHVQALIFIVTFVVGILIVVSTDRSPRTRIVVLVLGILGLLVMLPFIGSFGGGKLDDYLSRVSQSNGLNSISVTSVAVCIIAIVNSNAIRASVSRKLYLVWVGSLFSLGQSTLFLIFGQIFADVGIRLWQFSFLIFAIVTVWLRVEITSKSNAHAKYRNIYFLNMACLSVLTINVLIRYPLSNFFAPFFPQVYLDYIVF